MVVLQYAASRGRRESGGQELVLSDQVSTTCLPLLSTAYSLPLAYGSGREESRIALLGVDGNELVRLRGAKEDSLPFLPLVGAIKRSECLLHGAAWEGMMCRARVTHRNCGIPGLKPFVKLLHPLGGIYVSPDEVKCGHEQLLFQDNDLWFGANVEHCEINVATQLLRAGC